MDEEGDSSSFVKIKTPWTFNRQIIVRFALYLHVNPVRENVFKLFYYGCIPAKNYDVSVEEWLMKLEQSDIISAQNLEILGLFLKEFSDADEILSMIRDFQYLLYNLEMITGELDGKLKFISHKRLSARFKENSSVFAELSNNLRCMKIRISLSCFLLHVYTF